MKALILASDPELSKLPDRDEPTLLLPINGEPLLAHTLRWLKRSGIDQAVLASCCQPERVRRMFGSGAAWGVRLTHIADSTGGAAEVLRQLADVFDDTIAIVAGHVLLNVDLAELLDYHRARHALVTLGLRHAAEPNGERVVECDSVGQVLRLAIGPASWPGVQRTVTAGLSLAEPEVLNRLPEQNLNSWEQATLQLLVTMRAGVYAQLLDGTALPIRTPEDYEHTRQSNSF